MNTYFTSESVTEGHPDKICDAISDKILDEYLKQDKNSRVAIDVMVSKNKVAIAGQVASTGEVNIEKIARTTLKEIGYSTEKSGIDYVTCNVDINITKQSLDISKLIETGGAGDQGIMFGYATNETDTYMPLAIKTAHDLSKRLDFVRKENIIRNLLPDGKTQVTVEYVNGRPKRIDTIIISIQHTKEKELDELRKEILEKVILEVVPEKYIDNNTKYLINHKGKFIIGGPTGDTGLTGRKIIVDTYGGYAKHGGGAFSGKDATKVDRSAAYMLRHISKNIVANKLAEKCEIQASYGIGINNIISLNINTFGSNTIPEKEIIKIIEKKFDLTPKGMVEYLKLNEPIYAKTTNYGHFGKTDLPWERIIEL